MRLSILSVLTTLLVAPSYTSGQTKSPPRLYVSEGACPFEGCIYRDWIANRTVELMNRPGGRPVAKIHQGESVSAITGRIYTHPLAFRVEQSPSKKPLVKAGSTIYLLHPIGEGFWLVWHQSKVFPMDPQYAGLGPKYEWWARVKTPSGQTGWVLMKVNDLPFDRVDRLAS